MRRTYELKSYDKTFLVLHDPDDGQELYILKNSIDHLGKMRKNYTDEEWHLLCKSLPFDEIGPRYHFVYTINTNREDMDIDISNKAFKKIMKIMRGEE